jgi:hypothetical protein
VLKSSVESLVGGIGFIVGETAFEERVINEALKMMAIVNIATMSIGDIFSFVPRRT